MNTGRLLFLKNGFKGRCSAHATWLRVQSRVHFPSPHLRYNFLIHVLSTSCNCFVFLCLDPLQTWVTNQTSQRSQPLTRPNWRRLKLRRKTHCQQKKVGTITGFKSVYLGTISKTAPVPSQQSNRRRLGNALERVLHCTRLFIMYSESFI